MEKKEIILTLSFDDTSEQIDDLTVDYIQGCLNYFLEESLLKNLPFVKFFHALGKLTISVSDAIFANKVLTFFCELGKNRLSPDEIQKHKESFVSPQEFYKENGIIIKYIDSCTREKQIEVFARIYQGYLMNNFTTEVFYELTEVNKRIYIGDYDFIGKIAITKNRLLTNDDNSAINRLIAIGLVKYAVKNDEDNTLSNVELTELGSVFAHYIDITRYTENEIRNITFSGFLNNSTKYSRPDEIKKDSPDYLRYIVDKSNNDSFIFEYSLQNDDGVSIVGIKIFDRNENNVLCIASPFYPVTRFLPPQRYYTISYEIIEKVKASVGCFTNFDDNAEILYNTTDETKLKYSYHIAFNGKRVCFNAYNLDKCELDLKNKTITQIDCDAVKLVKFHNSISDVIVSAGVNQAYFSLSESNDFGFGTN